MSSENDVLLQMYAKAPPPVRDYYGIIISNDHVSIEIIAKTAKLTMLRFRGGLKHLEHFTRTARVSKKIQKARV